MLMMQDRAAIAKGLKEGCSLRRIADRIVWIGFSGVSGGYTVTAGSAGISPCGSRCETHLKRRTLTGKARQDSMPHRAP